MSGGGGLVFRALVRLLKTRLLHNVKFRLVLRLVFRQTCVQTGVQAVTLFLLSGTGLIFKASQRFTLQFQK